MRSIEENKQIAAKALAYLQPRLSVTEVRLGRQWFLNRKCCGERMVTVYWYTTQTVNEHCPTHRHKEQVYFRKGLACVCKDCKNVYYDQPCFY